MDDITPEELQDLKLKAFDAIFKTSRIEFDEIVENDFRDLPNALERVGYRFLKLASDIREGKEIE